MALATSVRYQALFTEAGGLTAGNDVTVSGMKVGTVSDVSLRNGDALVTFTVKGNVPLGADTTAHIRTGTLLGERILTLESAGTARCVRCSDPGIAYLLAVFADRSGHRPTPTPREPTPRR